MSDRRPAQNDGPGSKAMTDANSDRQQVRALEYLSEPRHQDLKDLYCYWLSKKGDRIAPSRSAIEPAEILRLLPKIALIDVIGDLPRFRFRLFGTKLVSAYGQDITGKFTDEIDRGAIEPQLTKDLECLVRQCRPTMTLIKMTKRDDGRFLQFERLGLPLSADGKRVNMLLFGFAVEAAY
jgi:hypothetical protein